MVNTKCVYTAIFGGYDNLAPVEVKDEGQVDYIVFSDCYIEVPKPWELRIVELDKELDNILKNRYLKILPYEYLQDYKESIYIDGNIVVKKSTDELFEKLKGFDMGLRIHPYRTNSIDELYKLYQLSRIDFNSLVLGLRQIKSYGKKPSENFYEANVIYRKHGNDKVKEAMVSWWNEFNNGVRRDQISLPYIITNTPNFLIKELARENLREGRNEYFNCSSHMMASIITRAYRKLKSKLLVKNVVELIVKLNH